MSAATDELILRACRSFVGRTPLSVPPTVDWSQAVRRAAQNRVAGLLLRALEGAGKLRVLPADARDSLRACYARSLRNSVLLVKELAAVLASFRAGEVEVLVLRGPALGRALYGDTAMRPFTDLDLLVVPGDVARARQCLERAGAVLAAGVAERRYFEKYHLHLVLTRPASGAVIELHWALDHRYTPYTIDSRDLFRKARRMDLAGCPCRFPSVEADLLANAVHLVKHACFLPYVRGSEALRRQLLDAGWLILVCDLALEIEQARSTLDWQRLFDMSRHWNVTRELALALCCARDMLGGDLHLPWMDDEAHRLSSCERLCHAGLRRVAGSRRLGRTRARAMLRPARALDLARYLQPGRRYLRWRYRLRAPAAVWLMQWLHPCVAVFELACHLTAWSRAYMTRRVPVKGERS